MANARILVVDDERPVRKFLEVALSSQDYAVDEASTGQDGIDAVVKLKPDVMILDLGLPDMDGTEVIRVLREWSRIPIIVLSVRGSENDKIAALDAGADDYLTKPFGAGELLARLRAALRRVNSDNGPVFISGELKVDLAHRMVSISEKEIQLTPNEYGLLRVLVTHSGMVVTHKQLLQEVWGPTYLNENHMLHVNISNLRRKIEPDASRPVYIVTEPGVGYRLRVD
jgi:two-component system, OmpR family, KDP operon response regulator KdpE